jgi:N-acetylmuramoyl-L-alanine amidase
MAELAIVVIDPGHGGAATIPNDSTWNNAVGPKGTLEKTLTLDIGLRVVARLVAVGHKATSTRTTDVNLRLRDRAGVAKKAKADVFVSIHFNGSTGHNAQGTETLVGSTHTSRSARLSLAVQDALLPVTKLKDRNASFDPATRIKPQSLGVLRMDSHHPDTATCLVEISFLDRADEEDRLRDVAYRDAIASAIATGIGAFVAAQPRARGRVQDFGDAIEAEAGTVAPARIERFLGLDKAAVSRSRAARNPEASEPGEVPDDPFGAGWERRIKARKRSVWADRDEFDAFIAGLNLTHFVADEFLVLGGSHASGKCKGLNTFPPRALWPNIAATALMLDAIRTRLGTSIRITNCYRSPAYNTCIKGAKDSPHPKFNAIDFTCAAGTPTVWGRIADDVRDSDTRFAGGIGIYHSKNFVHIDTRGKAVDWVEP